MGLNYTDHAKVYRFEYAQRHLPGLDADNRQEANLPLPKAPILFTKPRTALSDPYPAAVNIPKCAQDGTGDDEAELCVVIGRDGRDISETDALDFVLGRR